MALMKCPDCGKMVSSRATVCPDCGCPAEYFVSNEINEIKEDKSFIEDSVEYEGDKGNHRIQDEIECESEAILDEFTILGRTLRYPKCAEAYIKFAKIHNNVAAAGEAELRKAYKNAKIMDKVWDEVIPMAQHIIDKIVKENVGLLYEGGIYISEADFKAKYNIDMNPYLEKLVEDYDKVSLAARELQQERQYERSGRSRWQGGGFGIKGAIKGAVTAGAMNAVTGIGRSIGDSIVDGNDNSSIEKAKQKIYDNKSRQEDIFAGFRRCMAKADIGLAETAAEAGITERISLDISESLKIYVAAHKYEKDNHKLALKAIDALEIYPLFAPFYKDIIFEAVASSEEDIDELLRLMDFWNMNEDFKDFFGEAEKRASVNKYFEAHEEAINVDFSDYGPTTYIRLREIRKDLEDAIGSTELPEIVPYCILLKRYFENCLDEEFLLDSISVLRGIDQDTQINDYVYKIHDMKVELPGILKSIWIRGDEGRIPEGKIINKWGLPARDTIYMYQNKAIFGTIFGGKGFVLTNSLLCDLETKAIILLEQISYLFYDGQENKVYVSDGVNEIFIDVSEEKPASRRFLYTCLEEFIKRYSNLSSVKRHGIEVSRCASKIRDIIYKYAKQNNIDDADGLIEQFLKKHGVGKPKPKLIFCPYCGKKIMKTAKFCNFCGQMNKYEK